MTKRLKDKIASQIRDDKLDHRLVMAKYHLNKIQGKFNLSGGWKHFYFMTHFESFIFFASNAIEIITHEINDEFLLVQNDKEKTIYKIRNKLDRSIPRQRQIYDIIEEYFQLPHDDSSYEKGSKSALWCLREIRNIIAHGKPLIRTVSPGSKYYGFVIPYPSFDKKLKVTRIHREEITDSDEYFGWLYQELENFADRIREIIPKKYHSSQHKNQLVFEL